MRYRVGRVFGTRVPKSGSPRGQLESPVHDGVYHTITHPRADFPWSISPQFKWAQCQKCSALETSRQELSEDVWFGIGTLLVVE